MRRRLETLFRAGITLAAYHLPLDAHRELGNNAQLARVLGLARRGLVHDDRGAAARGARTLAEPVPLERARRAARGGDRTTAARAARRARAGRDARHLQRRRRAGIRAAAALGLDAWLTGEPEEDSRALAAELGISFIAAGHHATETFGVQALGESSSSASASRLTFLDVAEPCVNVCHDPCASSARSTSGLAHGSRRRSGAERATARRFRIAADEGPPALAVGLLRFGAAVRTAARPPSAGR